MRTFSYTRNAVNLPAARLGCFGCNRRSRRGHRSGIAPAHTAGVEKIRKFSPYLVIELLLPGGTLIALLLWLYRRQFANRSL